MSEENTTVLAPEPEEVSPFPDLSQFPSPVREWYYNTKTGAVEAGRLSPASQRMGPYPSRTAALEAWEVVRRRNEAWAAEDEAWREE